MEPWCLYHSDCFYPSFVLTRHIYAGRGGGHAPRVIDVSGGKGDPARQVAQCDYDSHITDVGHDTGQATARYRRFSGCCATDARSTIT